MDDKRKELINEEHLVPAGETLVGQIDFDELMSEIRL